MRHLILVCAAFALAACGQQEQQQAANGCALEASKQITWSGAEADTINARAEGPDCTRAFVQFSIRGANGDALWVFASTYYDLRHGGTPPADAPATTADEVQEFLNSWVDVTEVRTSALPAWTETQSRPGEGVEPFGYETPFDREVYEAMRTRDLPAVCYAAAVAAVQCLIIDPASHSPTMMVAYGS